MPKPEQKKTEQVLLRLEPDLSREFSDALRASDLSAQDALRLAARAMIAARKKYGRIPKDMEIRQAHIGDLLDVNELLGRVQAVAEHQGEYRIASPPKKGKPSPKLGGTGPVALVSDRPA